MQQARKRMVRPEEGGTLSPGGSSDNNNNNNNACSERKLWCRENSHNFIEQCEEEKVVYSRHSWFYSVLMVCFFHFACGIYVAHQQRCAR